MENKKSFLTVDVNITDTDIFQDTLDLFKEIFTDERINEEVRVEYESKLFKIADKKNR